MVDESNPSRKYLGPLTERTLAAVSNAEKIARKDGFPEITPELLMLGLLEDRDNVAITALSNIGLDVDSFRRMLARRLDEMDRAGPTGELPLSPSAEKVLQIASQEAKQVGVSFIGTEHLILGVVRTSQIVIGFLKRSGIDSTSIRKEILRMMGFGKMEKKKPSPMLNEELQTLQNRIEELNAQIADATWNPDFKRCMLLKNERSGLEIEFNRKSKKWSDRISIIQKYKNHPEVRRLVGLLSELKQLESSGIDTDLRPIQKKQWEAMESLLDYCEGLSEEK